LVVKKKKGKKYGCVKEFWTFGVTADRGAKNKKKRGGILRGYRKKRIVLTNLDAYKLTRQKAQERKKRLRTSFH